MLKPPKMKELPFIGSVVAVSRNRYEFLSFAATYGSIVQFHVGPIPALVLNRPEFVTSFLVNNAENFDKGWTMHRSFVGQGVFISEGELHKKQRKIMAPAFRPTTIQSYADTMAHFSEELVSSWHDKETIVLGREMNNLSTRIIGKTLFDEDLSDTDELGKSLIVVFNHAAYMVLNAPFSLPRDWPTRRNREKDHAWAIIRNRIQQMIDERKASKDDIVRNDFLSLLMQARYEDGSPMNDVQLMDEASTLFSGGQETVATSLVWVFTLLCQHPHIYQKVQEEVDSILAGRTPTYSDLKNLPYTLQVYKETLRLIPPASAVIRQALCDCIIENEISKEQYAIKKGTIVMSSIYAMHRQQDYFSNPTQFDPELHFSSKQEKQIPRYGFMPFGAGPRVCIGNYFAMMEGHLLLATLAQRVRFELITQRIILPSSRTLTTRPNVDVQMIVYHR